MVLTGFIVSIPDLLRQRLRDPVAAGQGAGAVLGQSVLTLGIALAGGLMLTHHAVPPTPGPLGVAGIYGVDLGLMILWGIVLHDPRHGGHRLLCPRHGPRIERMIQTDTGEDLSAAYRQFEEAVDEPPEVPAVPGPVGAAAAAADRADLPEQPSPRRSCAPRATGAGDEPAVQGDVLLRQPGDRGGHRPSGVDLYPAAGRPRDEVLGYMEQGVESAGIILLVTGAGGAWVRSCAIRARAT